MEYNVKRFIFVFAGLFLVSCTHGAKAPMAVEQTNATTSDVVRKVINELNLVYVEEGAQTVITYDEVNQAQKSWCEGLVEIGRLKSTNGDYRAFTEKFISDAYNYDDGKVFFKPTLTHGSQTFRNTKKGAISYFIGGDPEYPSDKGFALTPWKECSFENTGGNKQGVQIYGSVAVTMGNVWVTDPKGKKVMVDKTWVFRKDKSGKLRIIVHKSALPYNPK
jgi:hypothetical protein